MYISINNAIEYMAHSDKCS